MVGATPVFVEPDPATYNLDPANIAAAITGRTRVVLPTHLYGQPADLDEIHAVARQHGLRVIEDAAQAHGARYKDRRIGAHSDVVCWSFYPTKNLGAFGDAGAVTTNDADLARQIRMMGNYGTASTRYVSEVRGVNSRLDPVQAAILAVKLKHLDEWNRRRADTAAFYRSNLPADIIELPHVPNWAEPVWHLFVIRHGARQTLATQLSKRGIQTLVHYPVPPHLQPAYADLGIPAGTFPVAEDLAQTVLSLPIGPHLPPGAAEMVVDAVRELA
jgi:dTDP-4-amino-4,6-dideoxygalactose transaminase